MDKKEIKKNLFTRGKEKNECNCHSQTASNGAVYGFGFIGALIYYITTASSFWVGVLGILKAIVWPAMLVYGLLKSLGM